MAKDRLTLKAVQKSGHMADFIAQEEKRLPNGGDAVHFEKAVKAAVKPQQSKRQT
jgi:hypothetical protein